MAPEDLLRRADLSTGVSLSYVCVGPSIATPVLLLHAWGESRRSFDRVLPLLRETVLAMAIDQRGHGAADRPKAGYALAEFADDVVAFMDAVGLPSAVLVGSSSGGYVAQQVAVIDPGRVAGLVLVGSPRTLRGRPSFADEIEQLSDPVHATWVRQSLAWFPRFQQVPEWYVEDRVQDGCHVPAHVWRETLAGLCNAAPPTDTGTIDCPTLIIWGDRDELLTREHQVDLAGAIPGSRLVVYESTGHLVLWEQPERLASDLVTFVESLASRRGMPS